MKIIDIKYKLLSNKEIHYLKHYSGEVLISDMFNRDYIFHIEFTIEKSAIGEEIKIELSEDINYPKIPAIFAIKKWIKENVCLQ